MIVELIIGIICCIVSGIFWRLGGWKGTLKPFRAFGVSTIIVIAKVLLESILGGFKPVLLTYLIYLPALWGMMSLFSYGLSAPPHKFWVWIFKKGEKGDVWLVEFATRCSVGFFWSLASLSFLLGSFCWVRFTVYVLILTLLNGFIGASRKLNATWSEVLVGATVALAFFIRKRRKNGN